MRAMRLLIVSEPNRYGVMMYVRELIRFLHRAHPEIRVDYAYSSQRGSPDLELLIAEITERRGEVFDLRVGNAPSPGDVAAGAGLRRLVRKNRYEVVHAHSSKAGALTRLLALLPGFPGVLYTPHGYYGMSERGGLKDRLYNGIESALGRVGWTHNVSIHEREFARHRLGIPAPRAILVFSGVDLDRFRPASPEERRAARVRLGLPPEGRLLVTLGRDAYEKNYANLYAAIDRHLPTLDGVFFAHAGGGSAQLRATMSGPAQARSFAFEFLEQPEELLRAADGFALASRSEAFGLVAYEALGCGLPLILTATTGLLSLRHLGFPNIQWIPNPAEAGDVSSEIGAAIVQWAEAAAVPPGDRREVRRWFDANVQFEKLVRTYRFIARA